MLEGRPVQALSKLASLAAITAMAAGLVPALGSGLYAQAGQEASPMAANISEEAREKGRELFQGTGCIQCHALADAGGASSYAPSLDHNPELTEDLVLDRVNDGRGDMPSFAGILSEEEIDLLASYIVAVAEDEDAS